MTMNEIRFTTTDKDVYEAFSTLSIHGVEVAGEVICDDASQDWLQTKDKWRASS